MSLYSNFFYSNEVTEIFSDKNTIAHLLNVEAALAKAQAKLNLIDVSHAIIIENCCKVESIDLEKLKKEIKLGGNAAIPLVQQLTKAVKLIDFEASKFVHYGATSQDIVDTATVLQIKNYLGFLNSKLEILIDDLLKLAGEHKNSILIGRTLLQQAKPITFGLKICGWAEALIRTKTRLHEMENRLFVIQLGGAVGSENSKINNEIKENFADILGLKNCNTWAANRDNFTELASNLGIITGTIAKMATDLAFMMQTEVAEVFEGAAEGKGGSSTMPHKRNPVTIAAILANCSRIPHLVGNMMAQMPHVHERSAGLWHSEWELLTDIMKLAGGTIEKAVDLIQNLEVDINKMLSNLEITNGLIYAENVSFALAPKLGKIAAHEFTEKACKLAISTKKHLKAILLESNETFDNLDEIFDPKNAIGNSVSIVEKIVEKYKK